MARIVVQYPLQDLGVHQRAIEECGGHGYNSWESERERVGPPTLAESCSQAISSYLCQL